MSPDAIEQILLQVLLGATALFVIRLFWLRIHDRYPLYVLSLGLSMVFAAPAFLPEMGQVKSMGIEMINLAMDIFIAPFVVLELFRTVPDDEHSPMRFLAPAIGAVLAAGLVAFYVTSGLDMDSLRDTYGALFLMDTLVSFLIVGYLARKFRAGTPPGDANTMWIRRFFFLVVVMDLVTTFLELSVDRPVAKGIHIVYLGLSIVATVGCLVVLRKPKTESAPAA